MLGASYSSISHTIKKHFHPSIFTGIGKATSLSAAPGELSAAANQPANRRGQDCRRQDHPALREVSLRGRCREGWGVAGIAFVGILFQLLGGP